MGGLAFGRVEQAVRDSLLKGAGRSWPCHGADGDRREMARRPEPLRWARCWPTGDVVSTHHWG